SRVFIKAIRGWAWPQVRRALVFWAHHRYNPSEYPPRRHRLVPGSGFPAMRAVTAIEQPVVAPSDADLLARLRRADRRAMDELFRRYRTAAYRVAYRLLGHEADALDAVQNAFIKVFTHLDGFEGRSSFKTWLLRVVSNAALDLGRRR